MQSLGKTSPLAVLLSPDIPTPGAEVENPIRRVIHAGDLHDNSLRNRDILNPVGRVGLSEG